MGDDNDDQQTPAQLSIAEVHGQLADMSKDIKEIASSIASLVKVMTTTNDSIVVQNNLQRSSDPRMVSMTNPLRVTEESGTEPMLFGDDNARPSQIDESNTYAIKKSTQAFLKLAFALKKHADNKTHKTWKMKFKVPENKATRCLNSTALSRGYKRDSLDEDQELSRLQNFMLDTAGPLVSTFKELRKDKLDPDRISYTIQQALLFLGNASAHFSQIHHTKILKRLNPEVQSLAKDMDFS